MSLIRDCSTLPNSIELQSKLLKGGYIGDNKGDTRSLDYSSNVPCSGLRVRFRALTMQCRACLAVFEQLGGANSFVQIVVPIE